MTWYLRPSPRAWKVMDFLPVRLAGAIGCTRGKNMAPDQAMGLATISPVICKALWLPSAPPLTTFISAVDLPPRKLSVEIVQPKPNFEEGLPSSKSLIQPDSDPAGAGAVLSASAARFSFSIFA